MSAPVVLLVTGADCQFLAQRDAVLPRGDG